MIRNILSILLSLFVAFCATAQNSIYVWSDGSAYQFDAKKLDSIDFVGPDETIFSLGDKNMLIMEQGDMLTLDFRSVPAILLQDVNWSSSDENIAVVANGVVFAKNVGVVTISAEFDGNKTQRSIIVKDKTISLESISFAEKSISLKPYEISQLLPVIVPSSISAASIKWSTSNPTIVDVINGVIVAKSSGKAIISAQIGKQSASVEVNVSVPVPSITADVRSFRISVDDSIALSDLGVKLGSDSQLPISYSVLEENIAEIKGDYLFAKSFGTTLLSATIGVETIGIKVEAYIGKYELVALNEVITMQMGDVLPLNKFGVTVSPYNAEYKPIEWSIDGTSAMISAESFIALMPGKVVLTAKSGEKSVSVIVNIELKASSVSAVKTLELVEGKSIDVSALNLKVLPEGSTDTITLSSSDASIIDIIGNKIFAKKDGSCDIIAQAGDKTTEIEVNVIPNAKSLVFGIDTVKIASVNKLGINLVNALDVKVLPSNAAQTVVDCFWSVLDESVAKIVVKDKKPYLVPVAEAGETKVVASLGSLSDTALVSVFVATSSVTIDSDPLSLAVGDAMPLSELKVNVLPANSKEQVKWSSSNEDVFAIINHEIVAKKKGNAKLIASSGDASDELNVSVYILVDTVILEVEDIQLLLGEGGRALSTLGLTYLPQNADDADIELVSENSEIAKIKNVLGTPTIIPVSKGETNVIVKVGRKQTSLKVEVKSAVSSINIVAESIEISKGETMNLSDCKLEILPSDAVYDKVEWSIANTEIAEITADNKILAKKSGETMLSASVNGLSDFAKLVVKVDVEAITLKDSVLVKEKGESFSLASLEPVITPLDATYQEVEWSSSNTNVAEIKSVLGTKVIKCVGGGETTISAKCAGKETTLKLIVEVPVSKVEFVVNQVEVIKNSTLSLDDIDLLITPLDATNKNVEWRIENDDIASIDSINNVINGKVAGLTNISATVDGKSATVTLKVVSPLTDLKFSKESYVISIDDELSLNPLVTLMPEDVNNANLVWTVSDTAVAEVVESVTNNLSTLKPKKGGEVTLICKSGDIADTATVTVVIPLKSIELNKEVLELKKGDTIKPSDLQVIFYPENVTDKSLVWSSADENVVSVKVDSLSGAYVVTAVDRGSTIVTVSQGNISASVSVNVTVPVEGIRVPSDVVDMVVGQQLTATDLGISVLPENANNNIIKYSNSADSVVKVVSVLNTTIFTAKKLGESKVTATCDSISKEFLVRVMTPLESVSIDSTNITLIVGDTFAVDSLGITFVPEDATYKDFVWTSTNDSIAYVNGGYIVASDGGDVTLSGVTKEGKSVSVDVKVVRLLEQITLNKDSITIKYGDTLDLVNDLALTLVPSNATYRDLTWTSTKEGVVVVKDGKLITLGVDTCTLTATNVEGVSVSLNVTVESRVNKIEIISLDAIDMYLTQSFDLSLIEVKVEPEEVAIESGIKYSIINPSIADIKDSIVRAEDAGKTYLVAECEGMKDSVEINVSDRITYKNNKNIEFTMIIVDGGDYVMGETKNTVSVAPFMIAETEFTVGLWKSYASTTTNGGGNDNVPVTDVTEANIKKVVDALTADITLPGESRFTLPTEIQWEWAARGGKKSQGYTYAGSNNVNDVAWTSNNATAKKAVKTLAPNELGIYDMSGNASERCANDNVNPTDNENLDDSGNLKYGDIIRGGSISYGGFLGIGAIKVPVSDCEVSKRVSSNSNNRLRGFRVVMPVLPFPAVIESLK